MGNEMIAPLQLVVGQHKKQNHSSAAPSQILGKRMYVRALISLNNDIGEDCRWKLKLRKE